MTHDDPQRPRRAAPPPPPAGERVPLRGRRSGKLYGELDPERGLIVFERGGRRDVVDISRWMGRRDPER